MTRAQSWRQATSTRLSIQARLLRVTARLQVRRTRGLPIPKDADLRWHAPAACIAPPRELYSLETPAEPARRMWNSAAALTHIRTLSSFPHGLTIRLRHSAP